MRGNREIIHTEPLPLFTDFGIEQARLKGRSWVQRNMREWPSGHVLFYRIRSSGDDDFMDFYFIPSDDDKAPLF